MNVASTAHRPKTSRIKAKRIWLLLIGLPLTSGLLLITQPNIQARISRFTHQTFSSLDPAYRYPFYGALRQSDHNLTGQLQQIIAFHQAQTRQHPDSGLEQAALASAYLRMARLTGAGNWYLLAEQTAQNALSLLPYSNTEAMAVLARVTEAGHDFAGTLQIAKQIENPKEALPIQVTANLATGQLDAASQAADALVDATLSLNAFTLQALVKTAQGKDQEALQSFRYGLEVEEAGELTNSARIRTLLGRFYYERGQLKLAGDLYDEALQILPGDPQALLNQAQLAIRQGNYRRAEKLYAQIANPQMPTMFEPLILRGRAMIKTLQNQPAEALWVEAETLLRQSTNSNDASSDAASNSLVFGHRRDLARLLLERGRSQDVAEAISLMQAELKLRRDAETLSTAAWAILQANRPTEAKTLIQEALASGNRDPALFDRAAAIEQALGNTTEANAYWQQLQIIDPNFDERARRVHDLAAGLGS